MLFLGDVKSAYLLIASVLDAPMCIVWTNLVTCLDSGKDQNQVCKIATMAHIGDGFERCTFAQLIL